MRLFCSHSHVIRRADKGRMYVECFDCGKESKGINISERLKDEDSKSGKKAESGYFGSKGK